MYFTVEDIHKQDVASALMLANHTLTNMTLLYRKNEIEDPVQCNVNSKWCSVITECIFKRVHKNQAHIQYWTLKVES